MKFTRTQQQAITTTGSNLLVAASAGSGKTTVLIERLVNRIKNDGYNIDEFLVVTFTEAAASELKQRLRSKITEELINEPSNKHLRAQLPKIGTSYISTFHAFCNQVIRKFFYLIDFDPIYRISDDVESLVLEHETLSTLMEELFEKDDDKFKKIYERFNLTLYDEPFINMFLDLYHRLRTLPYKQDFEELTKKIYDVDGDLTTWIYFDRLNESIKSKVKEIKHYLNKAYDLARIHQHGYEEQYPSDYDVINTFEKLLDKDFAKCYEYLSENNFERFTTKKTKHLDEDIKNLIKKYRDEAKKMFDSLKEDYFSFSMQSQIKFLRENKPLVEALFYVLNCFDERFKQIKRSKGVVDFADLEELALKIITEHEDAREYYRKHFKEILIDEYQDTNSMQEEIVKAISVGNNVFMVGDVKQSIYRFRNAEPEIFQAKYSDYRKGKNGKLINLNENFRSRKEVLDFVNFIFCQLMDLETFEIEYDEMAKLVFGQNDYLTEPLEGPFIHLNIINKVSVKESLEGEYEKAEIEAKHVAETIRKLIDNNTQVYDLKRKELRPIRYSDIVILARTKNNQEVFHEVFKEYNIPLLTPELTGYFNSIEVLTVLSILNIIDNPLQDIPLVATLRSPIFNINEKDLIEIKVNSTADNYYLMVKDYVEKGPDDELRNKLKYFLDTLHAWREFALTNSLTDLLFKIYHETNYYEFVSGLIAGKQRQANLDLLYERAKLYEELSSNNLFKFIQLVRFFEEVEAHLTQARTLSDNEDMVRFMTMHKAKGLEFPVVFIVDLSRRYNLADEKKTILWDRHLGLAFSYLDMDYRVQYKTLLQNLMKEEIRRKQLAEELRLLYVAMTRAKEHLYLVGTSSDWEKQTTDLIELSSFDDVLLPKSERLSFCLLDLILVALARHPEFCSHELNSIPSSAFLKHFNYIPSLDINIVDNPPEVEEVLIDETTFADDYKKYMSDFARRLNFQYPHLEKTKHFAKQTIADIKRAQTLSEYQYHHEKISLLKPKFIDNFDPTSRGTAYHLLMQHLDYHKEYTEATLTDLIDNLVNQEILTEEQAKLIDKAKILKFLATPIAQEIKQAKKLYQEMPFTTLVSSKFVYPNMQDDVDILVQGVVDLFAVLEDYCVLLDFKTDKVINNDINRIKQEYQIQINVYKDAMTRMYQQKEIRTYLYLFDIDNYIEM